MMMKIKDVLLVSIVLLGVSVRCQTVEEVEPTEREMVCAMLVSQQVINYKLVFLEGQEAVLDFKVGGEGGL